MRVLILNLKEEVANRIIAGEKKFEVREIRPGSSGRFCINDEKGHMTGLKEFDAIKFLVGKHQAEMPHILVKLIGLPDLELEVDDDNEYKTYMHGGEEWIKAWVVYPLGEIIESTYKN